MKKYLEKSIYLTIAILVGVTIAYAGSLTPPGSVADTMYSLTDIYNLASGTTTTEGTGTIGTTPGTISETGKTLTEAYEAIAGEIEDINASTILTGTTIFGVEGSAVAGGLPKTGQTHCNEYADNYGSSSQVPCTGTNQDGDLKRGLARSYTDNADGTITDNATGLMWQKCSAGQNATDCTGEATSILFDDGNGVSPAINYCENLSLATHTDWHLPNVNELQSVVDYGKAGPAIDATFFPNTQSAPYWSSTAYENLTGYVWVVDFSDGYVYYDFMGNTYYVRCVRG